MLKLSREVIASVSVCLVAGAVFGCGRKEPSDTENVFGPDNRETPADEAPFRAIGRLDSGCSGTIIGRQLVLTAAHCIWDSKSGTVKPEVKYFQPDMRDGKSTMPTWIEYAWLGSDQPETERAQDWAIVRVADDVGTKFGTIAIHDTDFSVLLPYTVSLAGYSADRESGGSLSIHRGCYIHKIVDGKLFHDCDASAGVSGGPLLEIINGNPYVVGIAVSEYRQGAEGSVSRDQYTEDYTNVAVPATTFANISTQIIKNVDGGTSVPTFGGVIEVVNPNVRPTTPVTNPEPNPGQDQDPDTTPDNPPVTKPDTDPNPDQNPDTDPDTPDPGTPGVTAPTMVAPELLLRREGRIHQTMSDLRGPAGFFCEMGYRFGDAPLLAAGEGISDAIEAFDRSMALFVNRADNEGAVGAVLDNYKVLLKQVQILADVSPATLPARAVTDLEQARLDVQELIERLNALILI